MYSRSTQDAIAAMSYLAAKYDEGKTLVSSMEIAEKRNLPKPFVAKLLTILSQAGLVTSTRGPGGGYTLALPPGEITFYDVAQRFERKDREAVCPFGRGYCGNNNPCPIHFQIVEIQEKIDNFLRNNRFDTFVNANQTTEPQPPVFNIEL